MIADLSLVAGSCFVALTMGFCTGSFFKFYRQIFDQI